MRKDYVTKRRIRVGAAVVLLSATAALLPAPALPEEDESVVRRWTANAISMQGAGGRNTTTLDIEVSRWTTDEERDELLEVLQQNDSRAFVNAMRDRERVGTVRVRGRLAYDIQYSRQIVDGDRHQVILATDRPIGAQEASRNRRSLDFNISIVELNLDADGNGEGQFVVGAELAWDEDASKLEITSRTMRPVRLTRVRSRN